MQNLVFSSKAGLRSLLTSLFFFSLTIFIFGQNPCPPVVGQRTTNPEFPGCLPPGGEAFKVLLVLDESGSVGPFESEFENAVRAFANTLSGSVSATGQMQMGIVEFSNSASVGVPLTDVKQANFISNVNNYLNSQYNPSGGTNFEAALVAARGIPRVDMIFFITDGNPTQGGNMNTWMGVANQIKCAGTYIFGIGLGNNIISLNIQALSGPDQLGNPKSLQGGADWSMESFTSLPASLIDLANSQIDREPPNLQCSSQVLSSTDAGVCGKVVAYTTTATDNCVSVTLNCTPASGTFFNVGRTVVTCRATDNAGNASSCTFNVTINDLEAPSVVCPANTTVSCEVALDPANTGSPTALDNCGVKTESHTDARVDGSCPNAFSVNRTWTILDVHGNASTCLQTITVTDNKVPAITCPPAVTVACDLGPNAQTGSATATDNCDPAPFMSHTDRETGGDCDWLCTIQRTWVAADKCGNTNSCVQVITKDVSPLINDALNKDLDGNGVIDTLVIGVSHNTLALPPGTGSCVVKWLPSGGSTPVGLEPGNAVVDAPRCLPGGNQLDANNHLVDPLVAEALKLNILVRLNPDLGKKKLNTFTNCTFAPIILSGLARRGDSDVNELLRVTNTALGKIALQPHLRELLEALRCINGPLDVCTK
jgi:hypothetical protein